MELEILYQRVVVLVDNMSTLFNFTSALTTSLNGANVCIDNLVDDDITSVA